MTFNDFATGLVFGLTAMFAGPVLGQPVTSVRVATGLSRPVFVTHAPGDFSRVFVVEQRNVDGVFSRAAISILRLPSYALEPVPFLEINGVTTESEQGLLGLAFHPDYANNGYFYVNYTTTGGGPDGQTVVERYTVSSNPDVADPASAQVILRIPQPYPNHNGGWIEFGPDGYLYISTGDGGSGGDPGNRAQNLGSLLGKMLRIDVDGDDFTANPDLNYAIPPGNPFGDELWAYGLRNAWRCAFDGLTGDLYIGDVGQGSWEELNFQPASSPGGENYGWKCYEGNAPYSPSFCSDPNTLTFPFLVYGHSQSVPPTNAQGCSVTGGVVYRGCTIPSLDGTYFFADFCSSWIYSLRYDGSTVSEVTNRTAELAPSGGGFINSIASFGEDAYGEVYICDLGGEIFKIIPVGPITPDCNSNGIHDDCDIRSGMSTDSNGNGVLDECEPWCLGDADCSGGAPDFSDIIYFVEALSGETNWLAYHQANGQQFDPPPCPYLVNDFNGGGVEFTDVQPFVNSLGQPCVPY
jgi:glucose/arabinose dehydrogenase